MHVNVLFILLFSLFLMLILNNNLSCESIFTPLPHPRTIIPLTPYLSPLTTHTPLHTECLSQTTHYPFPVHTHPSYPPPSHKLSPHTILSPPTLTPYSHPLLSTLTLTPYSHPLLSPPTLTPYSHPLLSPPTFTPYSHLLLSPPTLTPYSHPLLSPPPHSDSFVLTENVFVPLLRASDNCTPPLIGRPWSPGVDSASPMDSVKPLSPKDPTYKLRALAGPMSPSKVRKNTMNSYY